METPECYHSCSLSLNKFLNKSSIIDFLTVLNMPLYLKTATHGQIYVRKFTKKVTKVTQGKTEMKVILLHDIAWNRPAICVKCKKKLIKHKTAVI